MDYKHSAFSGKEIQKEELRKQRKSEKELYVYHSEVSWHFTAFRDMGENYKNYVIYAPKGSELEKRKHGKSLEDRLAELAAQGLTPEDDF